MNRCNPIMAVAILLALLAASCGSSEDPLIPGQAASGADPTTVPTRVPMDLPTPAPTVAPPTPESNVPVQAWVSGADRARFFSGWDFEFEAWALVPFTESVTDNFPPGKFGYRVLVEWGMSWTNLTDREYGEALSGVDTFTIVFIWEAGSRFCEVRGIPTSRYTIAGVDHCGWEPQQELAIDAFEGPGVTPPGGTNSARRTSGVERLNGLNGLTGEEVDLLFEAVMNPYIVGAVVDPQDQVVEGACPLDTNKWGSQWMIAMSGSCP